MRRMLVLTALSAAMLVTACGPMPDPVDPVDPDPECTVERLTIETALEAWRAESGGLAYPISLEILIGTAIDPEWVQLDWSYTSDGATYTLDGPC